MRKQLVVAVSVVAVGIGGGALAMAEGPTSAPPGVLQVGGGFDFTRPNVVATGLAVPWGMAFLPDGSTLVSERNSARILRLRPGTAPQVVTTLPGVVPAGEAGLLGIAVAPTFSQDGWVYAYFTASADNRIVRFQLNAPQTMQVVLTGIPKANIHDGGRIAFGPDGMLYAATGDANIMSNAQNLQSLGGKILRMTPTGGVPAGNPFANSRVWSLGHRNVQGLAWDQQGRMYATEFGQNTWDEINQIVAGGNYGWPTVEGMGTNPQFRNPIVVWTTAEASPSGLAFANSTLFAAALRGTRLWLVPLNASGGVAGSPFAELQGQYGRLRTVMRGPDGWLWVATSNRDGRGAPIAEDDRVVRFPPAGTASPSPTPSPSASASPSPSPQPTGGGCQLRWAVDQWSNGFVVNARLTNLGPPINGWTITWTFPGDQRITNAWNIVIEQVGQNVTGRNAPHNNLIPTNGSVDWGFQATYSGVNTRPAQFRLNGTVCAVIP